MQFYVGLHQPSDARHFDRCMISIGRLVERNADGTIQRRPDGTLRARITRIECEHVMIDPQAFQILKLFGCYPDPVATYAELLKHICTLCVVDSATSEDWMCESFMLERTGLNKETHQRLTIERYDELLAYAPPCYIMPVLQGYKPNVFVAHIRAYGYRLNPTCDDETGKWIGPWVGVGSVCKRNADIDKIAEVLIAIKTERPDLRLHGFGVKTTALQSALIRSLLHTTDSMAWSFAARKQGRDANDWHEADQFATTIATQHPRTHGYQHRMFQEAT